MVKSRNSMKNKDLKCNTDANNTSDSCGRNV